MYFRELSCPSICGIVSLQARFLDGRTTGSTTWGSNRRLDSASIELVAFRSDLEAAHARAQALESKVAALEAENAKLRGESEPESDDSDQEIRRIRRAMAMGIFLVSSFGAAVAVVFYQGLFPAAAVVVGVLTACIAVSLATLRELVHVCPPGFVVILSGRSHRRADGSVTGYRVVTAGRVVRVPILESAQLLDCRSRTIECDVSSAYCKGGTPLHVGATAAYRLGSHQPIVHNAIERFLGRDVTEVDRVARETLEGSLRGVIACLTLEELHADKLRVAEEVIKECEKDMEKLGMEIDTLALGKIAGPK